MRASPIAILGCAVFTLATASRASGQIVTNGGFETGTFSGWTHFGELIGDDVENLYAHTGRWGAGFGAEFMTSGIFQDLTTTPGATYTLSFWLGNLVANARVGPVFFNAIWNGVTVFSLTVPPLTYTQETITGLTATGAVTQLEFFEENTPDTWLLDDVVVTNAASVTPEPATIGLLATGLAGMAGFSRRRRKGSQ